MMGTSFMLVIFMIAMMDYSELKAGLAITTLPAAGLLLTPVSGWLVDRLGPRLLAVSGALLSAAGLVALGYLSRSAPLSQVLWRSALVGAGLGLSLPALTASGMSVVPGGVRGAGAGMLNTARQLGFLLGVAILVAVFANTMHTAVNHAADQGQALTRAQTGLSQPTKDAVVTALDQARTINATAGISELRRVRTRSPRASAATSASSKAWCCCSSRTASRTRCGTTSRRRSAGRSSSPPSRR